MAFPIATITDLAIMGLQVYFNLMRLSGRTEEEIEVMFQSERKKFKENRPELLPKPPK